MQEEAGREKEIGGEREYFVENFWERKRIEVLIKGDEVRGEIQGGKEDREEIWESYWEIVKQDKKEWGCHIKKATRFFLVSLPFLLICFSFLLYHFKL